MDQNMDILNVKPIELDLQSLSIATAKHSGQWDEFDQYKFVDESDYEEQPSFQKNLSHDLTFILPTLDQLEEVTQNSGIELKGRIYAHKNIVAKKSEYFNLLLTNGMKESTQQEITIPNISVDIFFEILMFLYTSDLSVNQDNLTSMFLVCDQFLLEDGKEICRSFIKSLDNSSLERFLLDDNGLCTELTELYINQTCSNSSYFLNIERVSRLGKEVLLKILERDEIPLQEIEIFKSTIEWIKYNTSIIKQHQQDNSNNHIELDNSNHNNNNNNNIQHQQDNSNSSFIEKQDKILISKLFHLIRFPTIEYNDMVTVVEQYSDIIPSSLLLEAYRHLSRPKLLPLSEKDLLNSRLCARKRSSLASTTPGVEVLSFQCGDHNNCCSVSWPIHNFSNIKSQKHVSNCFEMFGLNWRMWAYPAGEAKHSDSFSVYLEAVRVKEKESYDFLRNTTFFFGLVNQRNKTLCRHYPSSPNVLFNYEKSVWGNGLIELKLLYDKSLGYMDNDTVTIQLHILECIALDG